MTGKWLLLVPLAVIGVAMFIAIGGWIVLLLWNWLLPPLFGLPEITFWQALGLLALCRILFGGFGMHRSGRANLRGRISRRVSERMAERMEHMTPEERERFRHGMRRRFGAFPSSPGNEEE